jgi:hypothetical protein
MSLRKRSVESTTDSAYHNANSNVTVKNNSLKKLSMLTVLLNVFAYLTCFEGDMADRDSKSIDKFIIVQRMGHIHVSQPETWHMDSHHVVDACMSSSRHLKTMFQIDALSAVPGQRSVQLLSWFFKSQGESTVNMELVIARSKTWSLRI